MSEPWFHRRREDEGTGYSAQSWQGMSAGVAATVVIALSVIIPVLLRAEAWTVYWIAAPVAVLAVAALLRLAKARSD
jgi:hypothetical protein